MVLGKLPMSGRPTNVDYSIARAYCAGSRCGWGCLDIFSLVYHFSLLSPSLWETARYRLKYCLKGPLSPKQPTNQIKLYGLLYGLKELCYCCATVSLHKNSRHFPSSPFSFGDVILWFTTFHGGLCSKLFIKACSS